MVGLPRIPFVCRIRKFIMSTKAFGGMKGTLNDVDYTSDIKDVSPQFMSLLCEQFDG